jgi:hypothetical protein
LLVLDVFFDDTEVHFSSSRNFARFGVVTIGVFSLDIGVDDLLILSDSDVRNLEENIILI